MTAPAPNVEQVRPDPALVVAHGARSLVMTAVVLGCALTALVFTPHLDRSWVWIAACYSCGCALAFPAAMYLDRTIPPGSHSDCRVVIAVLAAMLFIVLPDGTIESMPFYDVRIETAPPAFLASALAEGLARGLIPAPFCLLAAASCFCGASDGAWFAAARRHLRLTPVQALSAFLREARSPGAGTWRIVSGERP